MDIFAIQSLLGAAATFFRVEQTTLVIYCAGLMMTCNVTGKLIPDDATGWLAYVRKFCKVVSAYVPNRETTDSPLPPEPPMLDAAPVDAFGQYRDSVNNDAR